MILRKFNDGDIDALRLHAEGYGDLTDAEISEQIRAMGRSEFGGKYFRVYAVDDEGTVVGMVSMVQRGEKTINIRPETFEDYRRQGYAVRALNTALWHVKTKLGYKIAVAQVAKDNEPMSNLMIKLGFSADHVYVNKKGQETVYFIKAL